MRQIDELPMPAGRLVPVPRLIEELKAKLNDDWGTKVPGLIVCHARDVLSKACHGKQDSPITIDLPVVSPSVDPQKGE